jgi:hypothetical protein
LKREILPDRITAGLTLERNAILLAFLPPVWTLTAILRGPASITLAWIHDNTLHRLSVDAATTAAWLPGEYWYSVRATDGTQVVEVESDSLKIVADLASGTSPYSAQSHAERVLASIEAVIEQRASKDQERYKINNRELWRTPIADLMALRDRYKEEVKRAKLAKRGRLFQQNVRVVL